MKILYIYRKVCYPQVVPNMYTFLCTAEHKYFEESLSTGRFGQPLTISIFYFFIFYFQIYENLRLKLLSNKQCHSYLNLLASGAAKCPQESSRWSVALSENK